MYSIQQTKIDSVDKKVKLSTTIILPKKQIQGIIQIAHGMSEHKERYYPFMEYLASKGYGSVINDHRGHGKSINSRKELGYFFENGEECIVEDLYKVTKYIRHRFPNIPIYLFGHSMGTLIIRNYMQKYDDKVEKIILCGAPYYNKSVRLGLILNKMMSLIFDDYYRSKLLQKLTFGSFNKKFKNNTWLSTSSVKEYNNDPLCGFTFTLNGFKTLYKLMINCYSDKKYLKNNLNIPIYFIAGSDDPVIGNTNLFNEQILFLNNIGYHNTTFKIYKGKRHELLNEVNNSEIYQDIIKFIETVF